MTAAESTKQYKAKQIAQGRCPYCGRKRGKFYRCDKCHDVAMERQRLRRNIAKEAKEYWG